MPLTPKKRFLEENTKDLEAYRGILESREMLKAVETALLEYIVGLDAGPNPVAADAAFQRITGARAVLNVLLNIAVQPEIPARPKVKSLNYKV